MKKSRLIKYILLFSALALAFAFAACNEVETSTENGTGDNTEATAERVTDTEETSGGEDESDSSAPTDTEDTSAESESGVGDTTERPSDTEEQTAEEETTEEETTEEETFKKTPDECTEHAFRNKNGKYRCNHCGYEPACGGKHAYISDESGHRVAACDICDKAEGKTQDHEYKEKIDDGGDVWLYAFRCTVCRYKAYEQEVPYEINSFFSAGELSGADTGKTFSGSFNFDMGTGYSGFTVSGGGNGTVKVMETDSMDRASGSYLVMKVRLPQSQASFTVDLKSVSAQKNMTLVFSDLKPGWVSVIVDMTKAAGEDAKGNTVGYQATPDGEYYLGYLGINSRVNKGESLDIAYVMLCDKLEEAVKFTESEKQLYTYKDIVNEAPEFVKRPCLDKDGNEIVHKIVVNDDGTHTIMESCYQCGLAAVENAEHSFVQMRVDGDLTYACAICEALQYGAAVNKVFGAEDMASNAVTYFRVDKDNLTDEGELRFARYTGKGNVAQVIFARNYGGSNAAEEAGAFSAGKANMLLLRMRTNSPELEFHVYVSTKGGAKWSMVRVPLSLVASGEWATYAINLSNAVPSGFVADENGEYNVTTLYFQMGKGETGEDFADTVDVDIELMAFIDEWNEIQALVGEKDENVIRVNTSNKGNLVNVAEQKCVEACAYGETADGNNRVVACNNCGTKIKEYTVSDKANWYISGYDFAFGAKAYGNSPDKTAIMDGDGTFYGSITTGANAADALWSRYQRDYSWGVLSDTPNPVNVGQSRYLIIKLRASDVNKNFELFISTTGKNGKERLPEEVDEANKKPATRPTTMGSKDIKPPLSATEAGEWEVYVLDLALMLPEYWIADPETGDYIIDSFWITMTKEAKYDIEYMAFVDDFAAVSEIAAEDEVVYVSEFGSVNYARLDPATGKCSGLHNLVYTADTNDTKGYKMVCAGCGYVTELTYYSTTGGVWVPGTRGSVTKTFDEENGFYYNRFTSTNATHFDLLTKNDDQNAATYTADTVKAGRYVAIKLRGTIGGGTAFRFGTGDMSNGSGNPDTTSAGEFKPETMPSEWTVAVIELSELANYTVGANAQLALYTEGGKAGDVIDVAYVAFADSIEALKAVIEDDTYSYYGTSLLNVPSVKNTADDSEHIAG